MENDVLGSPQAGGRVIRGSAWRSSAGVAGALVGVATAALLLRHLGVAESGRYVTVISLLGIPVTIADLGLNISASRWLALHEPADRRVLIANILGQRLLLMPTALLLSLAFAAIAGYPQRMVAGVALAGLGFFIVALANALLLPLTVELRNAGLALVDFTRQLATFAGVAALAALGAPLTPFFAIQIAVGAAVVALVPALVGSGGVVRPRLDRSAQRMLIASAFPLAVALALGQLYFRLVIIVMSLVSSPVQTGYFGGSLRAIEVPIGISVLVAGVALPLLSTAARDDRAWLRYAVEGLSRGVVVAGVLVVLVTVRIAEPLMTLIGGHAFQPAGAVLRIQVGMLLFNALYQIWTMGLLAMGRQRDLIGANLLALGGLLVLALALVPLLGARGGAAASVLGDALLACLIYSRLRRSLGRIVIGVDQLMRIALAAALASAVLVIPGLPDIAAAGLSGLVFLGLGQWMGVIPRELRQAFKPLDALSSRGARPAS